MESDVGREDGKDSAPSAE